MRTIRTFYGMTADIAEDRVSAYDQCAFDKAVDPFFSLSRKLEKYAELDALYVRAFLERRNYHGPASTIRMLEAHGSVADASGYAYVDIEAGGKSYLSPVQGWITQHDGLYELLFVSCCNKADVSLRSKQSVLVYPTCAVAGNELAREALEGIRSESFRIQCPSIEESVFA